MGRHNDCCVERPTVLRREERARTSRAIQRRPLVSINEKREHVPSDKNVNRDARPFLRLRHTGGYFWRTVLGTRSVGFWSCRVHCLPFYGSQEERPSQALRQRLAGRISAEWVAVRPILTAICGIAA